ncbi:MAG: hypothetical protein NT011_12725 [Kiritimatiellaeota bacterium]|nr:hypothetical protein [Kiritimatiellota bacterium]
MKTQHLQRMLIGLGLIMALATPRAFATDWYVTTNGTGDGSASWANATTNLQGAINSATDSETVYVTNNATYYLTNQITVSYAITVRSWGPGGILDPTNTILDGNYPTTTNRHFTLNKYGATLAGFTLTNGWGESDGNSNTASGGSIYLSRGIVTNCIVMYNYALGTNNGGWGGGGILLITGSGGVWNCTISANSSRQLGGGIYAKNGGPWKIANCMVANNDSRSEGAGINMGASGTIISNCWIVSNSTFGSAGGVRMSAGIAGQCVNSFIIGNTARGSWSPGGGIRPNSGLIRNCLIASNVSQYGAGLAIGNAPTESSSIQNCTIVGNIATNGEGGGFDLADYNGFAKLENTIIWDNSTLKAGTISSNYYINRSDPALAFATFTNCCTSPLIVSTYASEVNTITNDPRFVKTATDNYQLQPDSPCINAGVNRAWMEGALDVYGHRRIDNFRRTVDIGAHEYLGKGTVFRFQ